MEMKISILCVIAMLATTISTADVPTHGLYSAAEGTPIFAFQPALKNPLRDSADDDTERIIEESSSFIEDIQEGDVDYESRIKRATDKTDDRERGTIDVDVNREKGQGTRMDVTTSGKVWESRDGNGRVDVQGNYGRTYGGPGGTGRPNYGGRITYSHRFRRSLQPRENDGKESGRDNNEGRGSVDVDINRQRGQGTRVDVTGTGKVWESRDGNGRVDVHGNYGRTYGGPGGTGRPNYGGRITYSHRFRRDANPGDEQDRGRVDVDVNREKGQGTRVDVTASGKVWESRDGNGRVDVHGNYGRTYGGPGGTGRPNYGGRITYSHRFRRSLQPRENDGKESGRDNNEGRGSVDVDINRQRGQGTRVDVTGTGKVWESRDGNGRVDVHGNYGRTYGGPGGTGRPNYGGRITYSHRFRRDANPGDEQDRGRVDVDVNREKGQGTRVDVTASGKVWESRDGNGRVDVHGNYGRTYGGPGGTGRPNYGGRITYSHRFRRSLQPRENDGKESGRDNNEGRGNVDVDINRLRGQGTRVDVTGTRKVWESRDGNGRVDVHGHYGRTYGGPGGTGRPNYGGGITYTHRFRRSSQSWDGDLSE